MAREVEPAHPREILGVLEELGIRASRGDRFESVHDRASADRVVVGGVEAVDRVDHDRDPRQSSHHSTVEPGLRVVGVQHVDVLTPEDAPELASRAQVGERIHRTGRRRQRPVLDALGLQRFDPRSRRADAERAPARVAYGAELRQHEEAQAHVDRGEVRDRQRPVTVARRSRHLSDATTRARRRERDERRGVLGGARARRHRDRDRLVPRASWS